MANTSRLIGLVMFGGVEFAGENSLYPSGVNKEYGYWRSSLHNSLRSNFDELYFPFEGSGVSGGSAVVYDTVNSQSYTVQAGVGEWFKSGQLRTRYGSDGIQERAVYLSKGGYVDAGSGIPLPAGFTAYAKITPSGDISSTVFIGQHKVDPANMVLGCNYDGKFYVRADSSVEGVNVPNYAVSEKTFTDYDYPAQVVGVLSSGDSRLRIYVNGKQEGISEEFARTRHRSENTRVFIGKREYPVDEGQYTGWIDEVGLSSRSMGASGIKDWHDDRFRLSRFIDDKVPAALPEGAASTGEISKCACDNISNSIQAEVTAITLPEGGTNKGLLGEKFTLTYDASATYTDAGTNTYTGVWDSGTASLACGGTVRLRLYCGASSRFYLAHDFSFMDAGEELRTSQACTPFNVVFDAAGNTSGGGACVSDDAAAEIQITLTGAPVQPGGVGGGGFGPGFSTVDKEYVQFVVESGNVMNARGGAFDKDLWGQIDYAVSSQISIPKQDLPENFYQLQNFEIDAWIEHTTNHHSGVLLSTAFVRRGDTAASQQLQDIGWYSQHISVPSGSIRKVIFSGVLPDSVYSLDGKTTFRDDFEAHDLKFILSYPQSSQPYDAEFKIYSTKMRYKSYDSIVQETQDATLFSIGAVATASSGIMNLFAESDYPAMSLPLFLKAKQNLSGLGDTGNVAMSGVASVTTNKAIDLFVRGGIDEESMNLYTLARGVPPTAKFATKDLIIEGGKDLYPQKFKIMPLFIKDLVSGSGTPSAEMILTMPKVGKGIIGSPTRLLYTKGVMPDVVNNIELYMRVKESGIRIAPLFIEGPEVYAPSSVMQMYLKAYDPTFAGSSYLAGTSYMDHTNSVTLFMPSGVGTTTNSMTLFMPSGLGTSTNNMTLWTRGYQS